LLTLSETSSQQAAPTLLVGVDFGLPHFDGELQELGLLAESGGLKPVARLTCKRKAPDPALFVGSGKADEIKALALMHGAVEVLFDQSLSPAQQRNLERHIGLPVNDRTLLILEIFGQRARSHEGKLQVELARQQYLSTRLVRRWSHLERQSGGIGMRGGPGETQIELDRRMINDSIKRIKERLLKVKKQRNTQRRQRERRDTFNISLVGYTNAGKSTLFNALVKARAFAADQLFATLDTTTRQLYLGEAGARCPCRTRWASSVICHTVWSKRSRPHCRKPRRRICCCMWSMLPTRIFPSRWPRCKKCWPKSVPIRCRNCSFSTNSMRCPLSVTPCRCKTSTNSMVIPCRVCF
jgi:GTPase